MTATAIGQPRVTEAFSVTSNSSRSQAVLLLQLFAIAVMVIPSNVVIGAIGAPGYPASLVGIFVCLLFAASVLFGLHDPTRHRHPIQAVLCLLWLSVLASYVLMDRGVLTATELTGADRMLIKLAVITGVALVAAEWLRSVSDVRRVARALCWGGAFCGLVAALQYWFSYDVAHYLHDLPGFTLNQDNPAFLARGALNRATGTAATPIELGVVAAMLVPIAIYVALHDRDTIRRWTPVVLIALGVATSVSRSGIVAAVVAFGVLVVLMPPVPRLAALCALPFAAIVAFASAHGLIGTLTSWFTVGDSDPSIEGRLHDYPLAETAWQEAPLFGHGAGTWIPADDRDIFDNQFLHTAVEQGSVGVVAVGTLLLAPAICALVARRRTTNLDLRLLCAALAAAGLAAAVSSLTFDSLAFPMFAGVYSLLIGMIGACWRLASAEASRAPGRWGQRGQQPVQDAAEPFA